jgi:hypothetical protein
VERVSLLLLLSPKDARSTGVLRGFIEFRRQQRWLRPIERRRRQGGRQAAQLPISARAVSDCALVLASRRLSRIHMRSVLPWCAAVAAGSKLGTPWSCPISAVRRGWARSEGSPAFYTGYDLNALSDHDLEMYASDMLTRCKQRP